MTVLNYHKLPGTVFPVEKAESLILENTRWETDGWDYRLETVAVDSSGNNKTAKVRVYDSENLFVGYL
mgnify:CR=1 FL=1